MCRGLFVIVLVICGLRAVGKPFQDHRTVNSLHLAVEDARSEQARQVPLPERKEGTQLRRRVGLAADALDIPADVGPVASYLLVGDETVPWNTLDRSSEGPHRMSLHVLDMRIGGDPTAPVSWRSFLSSRSTRPARKPGYSSFVPLTIRTS